MIKRNFVFFNLLLEWLLEKFKLNLWFIFVAHIIFLLYSIGLDLDLDPAANFYKIKNTGEHLKGYHRGGVSPIQTVRETSWQIFLFFFKQKTKNNSKKMVREFLVSVKVHFNSPWTKNF